MLLTALGLAIRLLASAALWMCFDDPSVSITRSSVSVLEANETLYFRTVTWGVAGGHWQVVLSRDRGLGKRATYDQDTEYVFHEPDGLLYRVSGKTVEIHAHWFKGRTPQRFNSNATVTIATHDYNPDWLALLDKRTEFGLLSVSDCAN